MRLAANFMKMVQTMTKSLPHSDGAATVARGNVEAMNCYFGDGCYFATVTFDKETGIELQAYSGIDIDINNKEQIKNMSPEELRRKAVLRKQLSGQYPGYSAFYFSQVLQIISKAVIAWDFKSNEPTEALGLSGIPTSVLQTIE